MELPTAEQVTGKRIGKFKQRITETLDTAELDLYRKLVEEYQHEFGVPVIEIAAALAALAQGGKPLAAKAAPGATAARRQPEREPERKQERQARKEPPADRPARKPARSDDKVDVGMERFRIEVGHRHGVKPGNIVGAIANEAEIESEYIGRIEIFDDYSTVQLPEGMPREIFKHLKGVWVSGQRLQISRLDGAAGDEPARTPRAAGRTDADGGGPRAGAKKPPRRRK